MKKSGPRMSETDRRYAVQELEAWRGGERGRKLTWALLEHALGFSRQTLSAKPDIAKAYELAKEALRTGRPRRRPRSDDYWENRVKSLEQAIAEFREREERMLERWACVKLNAQRAGFDWSRLDQPLVQPRGVQEGPREATKTQRSASTSAKRSVQKKLAKPARAMSDATGQIRRLK